MATLFSDNFSSYTPGSTNITGFVWENGGSPVVAFGTMTGSSSATGFFERSGQGLHIIGGVINENLTPSTNCQVNIMHWGAAGAEGFPNLQICTFDNANLSTGTAENNPSYTNLVGFNINADYTISFVAVNTVTGPPVYSEGVYVVTSTDQVYWPNTWQYYQMHCQFFQVVIASASGGPAAGTYIGASGTLAVDGTLVMVGTVTTSQLIGSVWTAGANVNQWRFPGRFGYLRFLGDMSGYTDGDILPVGSYTFGTSPIHNRLTQSVVEYSRAPAERDARLTQGVVEYSRAPAQRKLRWTQGVVEIIRRSIIGGWVVYET